MSVALRVWSAVAGVVFLLSSILKSVSPAATLRLFDYFNIPHQAGFGLSLF